MTLRRRLQSDEGFSLIEAVVASVILALTASVVAGLLIQTLDVAVDNTQRTTAANLAASQIEVVRGRNAVDIPDGRTTLPVTTIGATTYTVTQDAAYVPLDSGTSCSAGGAPAFKRVTVTVTWPNMGSTKPVRSDTLRALGFGSEGLESSRGSVAVTVKDGTGAGVEGLAVSVRAATGSPTLGTLGTDSTGCAVFTGLTAGTSYVASASTVGYADVDGYQTTQGDTFSAVAGQMITTTLTYAPVGGLAVELEAVATAAVPSKMPVTVNTSRWAVTPNRAFLDCADVATSPTQCVSGTTVRTASRLFPANYRAWAGTCADAEPAGAVSVAVTAGTSASITAPLAAVQVTSTVNGTNAIYAVHRKETGSSARCGNGEVIALGNITKGVTKAFALPYGTWYIQRGSNVDTTVVTQRAVLGPGGSVPPLVTVVS